MRVLTRIAAFGVFGWLAEYAFTAAIRRPKPASAWMIPIYGLAGLLFPSLHRTLRGASLPVRAAVYGAAMLAGEYAVGRALHASVGAVPWSYEGKRWSVQGVTRLDYAPLWMLYGLALERLDDAVSPHSSSGNDATATKRKRRRSEPPGTSEPPRGAG